MADRNTQFKDLAFGEKIEHIWEYYRWIILGAIVAAALVIYGIVQVVTPDPEILTNVVMINANTFDVAEENTFERYLMEEGYNTEQETITVNASLYLSRAEAGQNGAASYQALVAMTLVGEIDLLVGNEDVFDMLGGGQGLIEMSQILPADLLEKYQDRLYQVTDPETGAIYNCGIWLSEDNLLKQDGYYQGSVLVGIPYTATNYDMAREVLLHLLSE